MIYTKILTTVWQMDTSEEFFFSLKEYLNKICPIVEEFLWIEMVESEKVRLKNFNQRSQPQTFIDSSEIFLQSWFFYSGHPGRNNSDEMNILCVLKETSAHCADVIVFSLVASRA